MKTLSISGEQLVGMPEPEADALANELFDKACACANCKELMATPERKILNYNVCEKCWTELTVI